MRCAQGCSLQHEAVHAENKLETTSVPIRREMGLVKGRKKARERERKTRAREREEESGGGERGKKGEISKHLR